MKMKTLVILPLKCTHSHGHTHTHTRTCIHVTRFLLAKGNKFNLWWFAQQARITCRFHYLLVLQPTSQNRNFKEKEKGRERMNKDEQNKGKKNRVLDPVTWTFYAQKPQKSKKLTEWDTDIWHITRFHHNPGIYTEYKPVEKKKSYTKDLQIDALRLTWLETILGWKCYRRPECYMGITTLPKADN